MLGTELSGKSLMADSLAIEEGKELYRQTLKSASVLLKDYRPPDYCIDQTQLHIDLKVEETIVTSILEVRRIANTRGKQPNPLVLDGVNLELISLKIDGNALDASQYLVDETSLTIANVPELFTLECITKIKPEENTALVGLYRTQGLYCTQCEPEGFRRITYYLDRPDILSEFTTTIVADKVQFPVLLSNGNQIAQGDVVHDTRRHYVTWHDPFKKPSAIFAMVAGDLESIEDTFTTCSGRKVIIRIFADNNDIAKCHYAMQVTKQAMAWDEKYYGREYDLDIFMIAVIAEFNVGAMENKGLNVYRADRILIDPQTTCDDDIQSMTETIGHEYFHNWSGNRVTCRDWFQLTLKEGFTTYRGFQFCHDLYSRSVKRIEETLFIRTRQFAEDASPLSHPIRPEAYQAIWNFYTSTVYQKGAEVVRMLHTLLGQQDYRKGCDLFFDRHDGQATTTDDFIAAMESASNRDLAQFKHWYTQSGTPCIIVESDFKAELRQFRLTVKQCASQPLHIPMAISLFNRQGIMPLHLQGQDTLGKTLLVLEITQGEQVFTFEQVSEHPVPSLFRDFSAPVKWRYPYSQQDLILILEQDVNGFCQWDAAQRLWVKLIEQQIATSASAQIVQLPAALLAFYRRLLIRAGLEENIDKALAAQLLSLPNEAYLTEIEALPPIDVDAIYLACKALKQQFAVTLKKEFEQYYGGYTIIEPISISKEAMAERALRNKVLEYLVETKDPVWIDRCHQQFQSANNMTDSIAALTYLVNSETVQADNLKRQALAAFYDRWQQQPLVINQWLAVQAKCPLSGTLTTVQDLLKSPAFDIKNPSQASTLIGSFSMNNPVNFHHPDGSGFQFLIDQVIKLDKINPQIASRLLARSPIINRWRYDDKRQRLMHCQLQRLQAHPELSKEVAEVAEKCVNGFQENA